ncbi:MAG: penicillin-binding protein 1C [Paracoccaceae bacterium]
MITALGWAGVQWFDDWVEATELPITIAETSVEVRDRGGTLLRAYPVSDGIMRMATLPVQVDPLFVDMLLRYEDKRFRNHAGVDPLALGRATMQALWNGRTVSGGSTLTMQVARLLEDGSTGRWAGKFRQIRVALALERRLSKDEILGLYLTHAPYGGNLEGLRAASFAWFGKEPKRLTPAQAALLVALPQSPERRRPDRFVETATQARDRVLARMAVQGVIAGSDHQAALRDSVPSMLRPFPRLSPHLADRMRQEHPGAARIGLTLNAGTQAQLETLTRDAIHRAGPRLSAAMIVADHQTGEIIASVGSAGYEDAGRQGFVDMTRAVRSPGSTLKPLIYGLAFDQGLVHPETLIHDGPVNFDGYAPRNFDNRFRGDLRVRDALQLSLNIPVVKLTDELGPVRVMAALERGGAAPKLPGGAPGLAVALGGIGVTLEDLVQVYVGLASDGKGPGLHVRLGQEAKRPDRIISEVAAWHVTDILRDLPPPSGAKSGELAYKTGTSYGHRDAWAIGWDGRHVIGVWLGRPDGTPVPGVFGAELAAPLLFEAFGRLKPVMRPLPGPPPETLIVGAADLPQPLQRFRPRQAVFDAEPNAPELLFPPDGARLAGGEDLLVIKVRGGTSPFIILANGAPIATRQYTREFEVPNPGRGFASLVVVDRNGRTDRARIQLD